MRQPVAEVAAHGQDHLAVAGQPLLAVLLASLAPRAPDRAIRASAHGRLRRVVTVTSLTGIPTGACGLCTVTSA